MIALPDVNTLIALAWPNHVHHDAARSWFATNRAAGWATCTLAEGSLKRDSFAYPAIAPRLDTK